MQQASSNIGACGLCQAEDIPLCYSDLLPKAVVRWVRLSAQPDQVNPNPYFVTPDGSRQMNFRVAEYFLCAECEDRLNKGGESWTLKNTYRGKPVFPLRDTLLNAPPVCGLQGARIIDGGSLPQIQMDKLVYFALSVFWKASARRWWGVDHQTQLKLGPYETELHKFLLGQRKLSNRVALIINVSANPEPHVGAIYPYGGDGRVQGTRQYRFAIPGMTFWLHLGHMSQTFHALSALQGGVLCLASDLNEIFVQDMIPLVEKAKQSRMRRTEYSQPRDLPN